jgi:hypothetical protein
MKTFNEYTVVQEEFLVEGSVGEATNQEMVICYVYNLKQIDSKRNPVKVAETSNELKLQALAKAKVDESKFDKAIKKSQKDKFGNSQMIIIAKSVVESIGDVGTWLVHSGSSSGGTNYYGAGDTTPKADFVGNKTHRISLKKSDSDSGAQLMSAKSKEAHGVVDAAIQHYGKRTKKKISDDKLFKDAMDVLEAKLTSTIQGDVNVRAGASKSDFKKWYEKNSGRYQEIETLAKKLKVKSSKAKINKHMASELSVLGAISKQKPKFIEGITPITRDELDKHLTLFSKDKEWELNIGKIRVSKKHLFKDEGKGPLKAGIDPKELESPALKAQMVNLIEISMDTIEWKQKLSKFFTENKELHRWIVYEAATGLYKFTGELAEESDYTGDNDFVANNILVFSDGGYENVYPDIMKWSDKNKDLVNQFELSFKSSGRSSYQAFRIPTVLKRIINSSVEYELPTLNEEISRIEAEYLTEGLFGTVKSGMGKIVKTVTEKIKIALKKFYEKVIKGFMKRFKMLVDMMGISKFLGALGLDMDVKLKLATPRW